MIGYTQSCSVHIRCSGVLDSVSVEISLNPGISQAEAVSTKDGLTELTRIW